MQTYKKFLLAAAVTLTFATSAFAAEKMMKEMGMGKGYRYAHEEQEGYAAGESYLPDGIDSPEWYRPTDRGLEAKIREKLAHLRELDGKLKP